MREWPLHHSDSLLAALLSFSQSEAFYGISKGPDSYGSHGCALESRALPFIIRAARLPPAVALHFQSQTESYFASFPASVLFISIRIIVAGFDPSFTA